MVGLRVPEGVRRVARVASVSSWLGSVLVDLLACKVRSGRASFRCRSSIRRSLYFLDYSSSRYANSKKKNLGDKLIHLPNQQLAVIQVIMGPIPLWAVSANQKCPLGWIGNDVYFRGFDHGKARAAIIIPRRQVSPSRTLSLKRPLFSLSYLFFSWLFLWNSRRELLFSYNYFSPYKISKWKFYDYNCVFRNFE